MSPLYYTGTDPGSNAGMTIQNVVTSDHMYKDYNRTKTMSSFGSATHHNFRAHSSSDMAASTAVRNRTVRFMLPGQESGTDDEPPITTSATADYEEPIPLHTSSGTSTNPLVTQL